MQLTWRTLNIFDINSRDCGVWNVVKEGLILLIDIIYTYIIAFHDSRYVVLRHFTHSKNLICLFSSRAVEYISYCPDSQIWKKNL